LKTESYKRHKIQQQDKQPAQAFDFMLDRNQIWLKATVENQLGYFILDTGAPTLLLDHRSDPTEKKDTESAGTGISGNVSLIPHRVSSFSLGGQERGGQEAYLIDLSAFEKRSGNELLGMIGYEQLKDFELLIDCANRELSFFPARRNELHRTEEPVLTLRFDYESHLPILTLRNGKQKLRFAIDTGAGVNLISDEHGRTIKGLLEESNTVNVAGLDGSHEELAYASLPALKLGDFSLAEVPFVRCDLSELQPLEGPAIDGIIGPRLLRQFRISINFKKQKFYVWAQNGELIVK
jgi:hypothetical protein